MAARIAGRDDVAIVYFGEGTASTGDFHVGMNFAGVAKAPCIFFCRNNGWAISTPGDKQTAAKSIASRAVGYGMPGIRVDGNDILAVIQVTIDAVERARAGHGPTMIEALTYRRSAHSSSDDPSAYRDANEPKKWEPQDPVARFGAYLRARNLLDDAHEKEVVARHNEQIAAAVADAGTLGAPPLDTLFEDVYEEIPWHLREQREWLLAQPRTKSPHAH
jgi:TPP-dependent pyruvate/acetoin dehydrogenase alpha subunit